MAEWIVGAASGALVAGLLGLLVHQGLFHDGLPPELSVAVERVERTDSGTVVRIAVTNKGDMTAATVAVQAATTGRNGTQARRIEFDYVAGHAERRGAFVFEGAALSPDQLRIEITGYVDP